MCGVVLDQCFDSHISDLQVMVLAGFSCPEKLEIGTLCIADLQKFTGVLWGNARERGVPPKKGGNNFPSSATPSDIVCIHVCSDDLLVKLVFS